MPSKLKSSPRSVHSFNYSIIIYGVPVYFYFFFTKNEILFQSENNYFLIHVRREINLCERESEFKLPLNLSCDMDWLHGSNNL